MASTAIITRLLNLPGVPSASGAAVVNQVLYVVSDDSPVLFRFTLNYEALTPLNLFKSALAPGSRIAKAEKPDLESLTPIWLNGKPHLIALGSGATANRKRGFLISELDREQPLVELLNLEPLFAQLEKSGKLTSRPFLNLEGMAATQNTVYLVQRGVGKETSKLISIPLSTFSALLRNQATTPNWQVTELPEIKIGNVHGGFSGLVAFQDQLLLTASVEDTSDPVEDGQVLGSFVALASASAPNRFLLAPITDAAGKPALLKVESLEILAQTSPNRYKAIATTDNDQGQSELLELDLHFKAEAKK